MAEIYKDGIYLEMPEADYRADPCDVPSLTQSMVKTLLEKSPRHAWLSHPRLNPNFVADDDKKFDIGNVAHALLLGRGKQVVGLPFDSWATKAAKEARAGAKANGTLAVLQEQYDRAAAMAEACRQQLAGTEHSEAFYAGDAEVVALWHEDKTAMRTMIDWVAGGNAIYDYKTSDMSCAPHMVIERASMVGWDIQAAFYRRGLNILEPNYAGRHKFYFVNQETDPPYALSVIEISEGDLFMGEKKIDFALRIWRECMERSYWPLYPQITIRSRTKPWTETRHLEREIEEEDRRAASPAKINPEILMAG